MIDHADRADRNDFEDCTMRNKDPLVFFYKLIKNQTSISLIIVAESSIGLVKTNTVILMHNT